MKLALALIPISAALSLVVLSSAQDAKKPAAPSAQDHASHMAAGPVTANQKLAQHAGKYVAKTKFDMGNGAPPMESQGEATFESVLGGRFLLQRETNSLMGQSFESLKMYGYNVESGRYEGTWTYTESTAIMHLNGTSTDNGKTIVFTATYEGKDRKPSEFEITLREIDASSFSTKLVDKASSATFETTYTRAK
jgi:hypothetical protein